MTSDHPSSPEAGVSRGIASAAVGPDLLPGVSTVREEIREVPVPEERDLGVHEARSTKRNASREVPVPFVVHTGWEERFPWVVQGVTTRGEPGRPFDLALFGRGPAGDVQKRWSALARVTGAGSVVHGRQVHGVGVRLHDDGPPGLQVAPATDGHATRSPGVLLTVTTADCVPVFVVDPVRRAVLLLHAGWRGIAAGILEAGTGVLADRLASRPDDLHVHLGPAVCGACYEVGPEVHEALGLKGPGRAAPVDVRAALAERAVEVGVPEDQVTVSSRCTLCDQDVFFSHRGGDGERQVAFLGVRR